MKIAARVGLKRLYIIKYGKELRRVFRCFIQTRNGIFSKIVSGFFVMSVEMEDNWYQAGGRYKEGTYNTFVVIPNAFFHINKFQYFSYTIV